MNDLHIGVKLCHCQLVQTTLKTEPQPLAEIHNHFTAIQQRYNEWERSPQELKALGMHIGVL